MQLIFRYKRRTQTMTDLAPRYSLISLIGAETCSYYLDIREEQVPTNCNSYIVQEKEKIDYTYKTTMHMLFISHKTEEKKTTMQIENLR
jgi:hypothetical protein